MTQQKPGELSGLMVPFQYPAVDGRKRRRRQGIDDAAGGTPASPRMRKACNYCRQKKARCSGHDPCIRCQNYCQVCEYTPTASSSRQLDRLSGCRRGDTAGTISPTRTVISVHSRQDTAIGPEPSPTRSTGIHDAQQDEDAPDVPLQEDRYGHIHGGASEFAFLNLAKQKLASLPSMPIDFCDYPLVSSGGPGVMPPKQIADQLISNYFDFGLATSRFVHQPSLIVDYENLYDPGACCQLASDKLALIYMVLAWGSHYSPVRNVWCGYSASVQFYEMAERQRHKEPNRTTLSSLQSELLISLYLLNHSRMHEAWSLFVVVVRHAQALGLHRRSSRLITNYVVHEYRKRLLWAIFIHDKLISSIFGRPYALHDIDIDQEECALANDEDITTSTCRPSPQDTSCLAAGLVHYARLAKILGRILRKVYGPEGRKYNIQSLCDLAIQLEGNLTSWKENLPTYLDYTNIPLSALCTIAQRQVSTLKLTYAHAILLLCRPFILFSLGSGKPGASNHQYDWVKGFHDKAIWGANMIVCECKHLANRGLFSREFTMVTYLQFAAIGTLFMYCYLWPEATEVRRTAEEAKAAFSVAVEGDLVGQRYIRVLDELSKLTTGNACAALHRAFNVAEDTQTEDHVLDFSSSSLDFVGLWSNLFFDPTALGEFVDPGGLGNLPE